jgi:light-regulated signal transduction histidine kinase (bacteriophytochrome)
MENTQHAVLNILEDYSNEKLNLESTQRAVLNILEDYSVEKEKVEIINKDLKFLNSELEQFLYIASHHLQEPLRMVNSYLQLLEKRYKDKLDQDANEFIQFAVEGSNRMKALIVGLLDYSTLSKMNSVEIIHVNDIISKVIENLKLEIKNSNAVISLDNLPSISGNKVEITRLFENLISNAIKFKSERNPEILITGKKGIKEYIFSVKDNGIGIQKEYQGKLFTIFQRLNAITQYSGTGIGLALCKKIVEKHGGKIWVESEFGKGSTFYFTIKE